MTKIGIIGGGFSGLAIAYFLKEYDVTILESDRMLGGLASWIEIPEWEWSIEKFVHHWFANEKEVIQLCYEMGMQKKLIVRDTKSSCYYNGKIAELDSAISLLMFPFLNIFNRLRMGAIMALLKLDKYYLKYEKMTAYSFLKKTMGNEVFEVMWKPLLIGKFGKHAENINAAWFWGRVHPRTKSLVYIQGGFKVFVDSIAKKIEESGGKIMLNTKVKRINKKENKFEVEVRNKKLAFDYLVLAVPLQVALILYDFPKEYKKKYKSLKSIGAQYFILALKKQFLDGTYWLTINDDEFPFMVVVEHTTYVDKKYYADNHLIWVGKYLDYDDPLWKLNKKELLEKTIPYLKRVNPKFERNWIKKSILTRVKNAQHIVTLNYSKNIPKIETPIENLYIANMNQIYPFDRGTNNAVILSAEVAEKIKEKIKKDGT